MFLTHSKSCFNDLVVTILVQCTQSTPASPICANSTPPDSSAICPKTDTSTLADRTCCGYGTCGAVEGPKHDHLKTGIIVLIVILAAAAFVVVGFFTFLAYRHHRDARRAADIPPFND